MRRRVVRSGLKLIIAAVALVIAAAFFHDWVASLLFLSPGGETEFIFLGFFWGGILGFIGIIVAIAGLLMSSRGDVTTGLLKPVILLALLLLLFLYLFLTSFTRPERPILRPGETITI